MSRFQVVSQRNDFAFLIFFGGNSKAFSEFRIELFEDVIKFRNREKHGYRLAALCNHKALLFPRHLFKEGY